MLLAIKSSIRHTQKNYLIHLISIYLVVWSMCVHDPVPETRSYEMKSRRLICFLLLKIKLLPVIFHAVIRFPRITRAESWVEKPKTRDKSLSKSLGKKNNNNMNIVMGDKLCERYSIFKWKKVTEKIKQSRKRVGMFPLLNQIQIKTHTNFLAAQIE